MVRRLWLLACCFAWARMESCLQGFKDGTKAAQWPDVWRVAESLRDRLIGG